MSSSECGSYAGKESEKVTKDERVALAAVRMAAVILMGIMLVFSSCNYRVRAEEVEDDETTDTESTESITESIEKIGEKVDKIDGILSDQAIDQKKIEKQGEEIEAIKEQISEIKAAIDPSQIESDMIGPTVQDGNYCGINKNLAIYVYEWTTYGTNNGTNVTKTMYSISNSPTIQFVSNTRQIAGQYVIDDVQQTVLLFETVDDAMEYTPESIDLLSDYTYTIGTNGGNGTYNRQDNRLITTISRDFTGVAASYLLRAPTVDDSTADRQALGVTRGNLTFYEVDAEEETIKEVYQVSGTSNNNKIKIIDYIEPPVIPDSGGGEGGGVSENVEIYVGIIAALFVFEFLGGKRR